MHNKFAKIVVIVVLIVLSVFFWNINLTASGIFAAGALFVLLEPLTRFLGLTEKSVEEKMTKKTILEIALATIMICGVLLSAVVILWYYAKQSLLTFVTGTFLTLVALESFNILVIYRCRR